MSENAPKYMSVLMLTWAPIESAPKYMSVLVWDGKDVSHSIWGKASHVSIYGWLNLYSDAEDTDLMYPQPTHWMPMPEPPK